MATDTGEIDVHELTRDEAYDILDGMAHYYLGMSAAEFIRAWDAGAIVAGRDNPEVIRLAMLVDLGRQDPR